MTEAKERLNTLLNKTDTDGRRLIYDAEDNGKLYLTDGDSRKCLGHILCDNGYILYTKFEDESQIFRKTNAWSINRLIVNRVDVIHYETRTYDYEITRERALEFGEHLHFADSTELKLYVPLIYWEKRHKGLGGINPLEVNRRNAIGDSWYEKLKPTIDSPLIEGISKFLKERRKTVVVYPSGDRVFRAFKLCTYEHTKVVILGQDPYIDGSASGLAFGYLDGCKKAVQKSLDIIYAEVEDDMYSGFHLDHDFTLEKWAKQGVLLLNSVLTVDKGKTGSHKTILGWERFTKIVLYTLMEDITHPKVFMIWGNDAKDTVQAVLKVVDSKGIVMPHKFLWAKHPASDLYSKDQFGVVHPNYPNTYRGSRHFSQANEFLKSHKRKEIEW